MKSLGFVPPLIFDRVDPFWLAGGNVERDERTPTRDEVKNSVHDRGRRCDRHARLEFPLLLAGLLVDREEMSAQARDVDDAIRNRRRGHDGTARLECPFDAAELRRACTLVDTRAGDIAVECVLGERGRDDAGEQEECGCVFHADTIVSRAPAGSSGRCDSSRRRGVSPQVHLGVCTALPEDKISKMKPNRLRPLTDRHCCRCASLRCRIRCRTQRPLYLDGGNPGRTRPCLGQGGG